MRKRGQSSVEFTFLISFMFLVFVVFFYVAGSRFASIKGENEKLLLEDFGDYLKAEISLAASAADGYQRVFEIPSQLGGRDYNVNIIPNGTGHPFSEMAVSYYSSSVDYTYVTRLPMKTIGEIYSAASFVLLQKLNNQVVINSGICLNEGEQRTIPCGLGECYQDLIQTCTNKFWNPVCNPNPPAEVIETCDGLDNDCDGLVDEDVTQQCGSEYCHGTKTCTNGQWSECSSKGQDAGICAICSADGNVLYDPTQTSDCDDDLFCTIDSCQNIGYCEHHNTCDDDNLCTIDKCDENKKECLHNPKDCSMYDKPEIATCNNIPDSNPLTWDYRAGFVSECNQVTGSCTYGSTIIRSQCSVESCSAECDARVLCKIGSCNLDTCKCSSIQPPTCDPACKDPTPYCVNGKCCKDSFGEYCPETG